MDKTYFGTAYYPELWPKDDIDTDIEWMKKTGINVVRIGDFAGQIWNPP